ncbi:uncharacterized protein LOC114726653 isoform X2 [Neltuma alba]|uniref:uncharacterized protein LOC114726653 isoform X2 n=1 Tax=Neltuma alba TaxID=207710 RepID=UPI0010A4D93A|nr:uncharacterized protein LOC114726653 isoform X2 [Prosopis alba]
MRGKWEKVIGMYRQDAGLHKATITRSGHTALHIAVAHGKEDVVEKMVDAMSRNGEERKKALQTSNNRNNTALHLAAYTGNSRMCHIIASLEPTLVDDRNVDGETPLFLAAIHGRKQAFLCLHFIRKPHITTPPFDVNCRRNNGDTILHAAIHDLAFQIIHLHEDLANWVNEKGCSPLHLLASKPCAFKSGSCLGWMETIIYHCIYIEKLKLENQEHHKCPGAAEDSDCHDCPDNYNILWEAYSLIKTAVKVVAGNISKPFERDAEDPGEGGSREDGGRANPLFPANYQACCDLIKFFYLVIVTMFGKGSEEWRKIYEKKRTHTWSVQIVKQLLHSTSLHEYEDDGGKPQEGYNTTSRQDATSDPSEVKPSSTNDKEDKQSPKRTTAETPILAAAKTGVVEMIEEIVEFFPVAIYDQNEDKKNIVLLAAEHSQPKVFEFLLEKDIYKDSLFHQVDKDGNSALHLAATLGDDEHWLIPGEALQMQWERKWYRFVKETTPCDFIGRYNRKNETPDVIFAKTHRDLEKRAADWLNKTSESCSLVAALVATVAFATAATVPGGVVQETGHPTLEGESQFQLFAISSLIALGSSVTALVMFLSILTSRFQEQDFDKVLPTKLLIGLTSLFVSIASMLVSFCAGHFFVLKDTLHYLALPLYGVTCLPVTLFVLAQFPLYIDLLSATFKHVPKSSGRPMLLDVNGDPQQTLANKVDRIINLLSHGAGKQQEGNEKGMGQGHQNVPAS